MQIEECRQRIDHQLYSNTRMTESFYEESALAMLCAAIQAGVAFENDSAMVKVVHTEEVTTIRYAFAKFFEDRQIAEDESVNVLTTPEMQLTFSTAFDAVTAAYMRKPLPHGFWYSAVAHIENNAIVFSVVIRSGRVSTFYQELRSQCVQNAKVASRSRESEYEDSHDDSQDEIGDINTWSASVINPPIFCPPGYVAMVVRRRKEPDWAGPKELRPFVTTVIPCDIIEADGEVTFWHKTRVHLKILSKQKFKDDLRSHDTLFSNPGKVRYHNLLVGRFMHGPEPIENDGCYYSMKPYNIMADVKDNFHGHFNDSQMKVYDTCCAAKDPILLVNGPPGTGKTEVMVTIGTELALVPGKQVLYVSEGNTQMDNAALRFRDMARNHSRDLKVIRVYSLQTGYKDITSKWVHSKEPKRFNISDDIVMEFLAARELLQVVKDEMNRPSNPRKVLHDMSLAQAMIDAIPVLINTALISNMMVALTNIESLGYSSVLENQIVTDGIAALMTHVLGAADVLCITLNMATKVNFYEKVHPDLIIQDDACRSKEISSLALMAFYDAPILSVGDPQQLGPTVLSAGRHTDKVKPFVNPWQRQSLLSLHERLITAGLAVTVLKHQFRSHGGIFKWASKEFYHDTLIDASRSSPETQIFRAFTEKLGTRATSMLFVHTKDCRSSREPGGGTSIVNPDQEGIVVQHIKDLINFPNFTGDIMVICMYKAMMSSIEKAVKIQGLQDQVEITTVDGSQGKEASVVMLATGRSSSPGFIGQANRMNVATTRAKYGFMIYGTTDCYTNIAHYRRRADTRHIFSLFDFCIRTGRVIEVWGTASTCSRCGQRGHKARDCRRLQR
ncbi:Regulator of nonsense transcripts 1-like protein 1 [Phlyctema vagabunda]|uniref:Regulator of nonsense transcripts 1-like protein 1 n=1 Tax=Phlyctema vagabunda TaxID=108571 RepID=A0ABR4PE53_9HELO